MSDYLEILGFKGPRDNNELNAKPVDTENSTEIVIEEDNHKLPPELEFENETDKYHITFDQPEDN